MLYKLSLASQLESTQMVICYQLDPGKMADVSNECFSHHHGESEEV